MARNLPNLTKDMNVQIEEAERIQNKVNQKKFMLGAIMKQGTSLHTLKSSKEK